jgi:uncharacterized protein (DUF2236 family)
MTTAPAIEEFRRMRAAMRGEGTGVPLRPREDDGLFGPGTPTWTVWGASTITPAGYRATVVQMLLPAVAAAVDQFSSYTDDLIGRTRRTGHYFAAVALGDTRTAQETARFVNGMHARVVGHEPITATTYRARDRENLLYVHVTSWHSALALFERYRRPLSPRERAQYWRESQRGSELVGVPADVAPSTHEEVREYFREVAPRLAVGHHARSILDFFDRPLLPEGPTGWALKPAWALTKLVAVPTLPASYRGMINIPQSRLARRVSLPVGRRGLAALEKPCLRRAVWLISPEAYLIQQDALRRQRQWERRGGGRRRGA